MGTIKLESDESGYSSVFHGWMLNLPEDAWTTRISMKRRDFQQIPASGRVRLVQEGRPLLETRLEALLEGVQIALPVVGDIFFETIPGGAFTMLIEWERRVLFEIVVGEPETTSETNL